MKKETPNCQRTRSVLLLRGFSVMEPSRLSVMSPFLRYVALAPWWYFAPRLSAPIDFPNGIITPPPKIQAWDQSSRLVVFSTASELPVPEIDDSVQKYVPAIEALA